MKLIKTSIIALGFAFLASANADPLMEGLTVTKTDIKISDGAPIVGKLVNSSSSGVDITLLEDAIQGKHTLPAKVAVNDDVDFSIDEYPIGEYTGVFKYGNGKDACLFQFMVDEDGYLNWGYMGTSSNVNCDYSGQILSVSVVSDFQNGEEVDDNAKVEDDNS